MGQFIAASAFKNVLPENLSREIVDYAKKFDVACELAEDDSPTEENWDILIYKPQNGWTVVLWPTYFGVHDFGICREISEKLGILVSSVHVYDGDYWSHGLFENGKILDLFCSRPTYFEEHRKDFERLKKKWQGKDEIIAGSFGVQRGLIAPYLKDIDLLKVNELGKVFPNDQFELSDFWVFVDFWQKAGIIYPDYPENSAYEIRLRLAEDFGDKLPAGGFEL
jgi:hypothetical protein